MRVLLVEHDESIAEPLIDGLARYGITADHVATGAAALAAAPHDLVLLGPRLPDIDGTDLCRQLRRAGTAPMIMLTGPGDDPAPGADDHLARPFSVGELVARMRTVAGRTVPAENPVHRYGPLAIDTRTRQIRLHGVPIPLAPKEYDLLVLLAADPGAIVDRRHILETVWEPDFLGPGKTLDFHVASLRRKLGDAGWIENRRGVGFRLVVPA
ncbi:response regulator transcription factor [Actinoplanes sp. NPDC049599]|uniref:response regulator transcription factor n=1 Tax=Actinoplanes sp. NPDC049599 TaxID=3363903 RepID=UPI0037917DD4